MVFYNMHIEQSNGFAFCIEHIAISNANPFNVIHILKNKISFSPVVCYNFGVSELDSLSKSPKRFSNTRVLDQ